MAVGNWQNRKVKLFIFFFFLSIPMSSLVSLASSSLSFFLSISSVPLPFSPVLLELSFLPTLAYCGNPLDFRKKGVSG